MMPKIRATTSRGPSLDQPLPVSSSIPGTAAVATPRAAAETTTRRRNLIVPILLDISRSARGERPAQEEQDKRDKREGKGKQAGRGSTQEKRKHAGRGSTQGKGE